MGIAIGWPWGRSRRLGAIGGWPRIWPGEWLLLEKNAEITHLNDALAPAEQPHANLPADDSVHPLPSFEVFFRRHEREIFGYLWRMTDDEQAAYDLSQETFVRAWQHFGRIATYDRPGGGVFWTTPINRFQSPLGPVYTASYPGPAAPLLPTQTQQTPTPAKTGNVDLGTPLAWQPIIAPSGFRSQVATGYCGHRRCIA